MLRSDSAKRLHALRFTSCERVPRGDKRTDFAQSQDAKRSFCVRDADWHSSRFEGDVTLLSNRLPMIRNYLQAICPETWVLYEYPGALLVLRNYATLCQHSIIPQD